MPTQENAYNYAGMSQPGASQDASDMPEMQGG